MSSETFNSSLLNPIDARLHEDVEKMKTSLLACTNENGITAKGGMQLMAAARVQHQMKRIVKYLELMDKLEAKLYTAMEEQIDKLDPSRLSTISLLMDYQERLQKTMIESHKLLQPYLQIESFSALDMTITAASSTSAESTGIIDILPPESRDRLRTNAQAIIMELQREAEDNAI